MITPLLAAQMRNSACPVVPATGLAAQQQQCGRIRGNARLQRIEMIQQVQRLFRIMAAVIDIEPIVPVLDRNRRGFGARLGRLHGRAGAPTELKGLRKLEYLCAIACCSDKFLPDLLI